ncbi:DUF2220 domain-containing protein [Fodinisporobacter ferrooxydans]|uniref:DUF2220 domain-containing protein n=1 Tax=Fodinisporobacter ferrooxydans TaxID=2901836 RepID=A0ABY4CL39_9BACL|nr:DUF2220 domain-containing protein [Alicyclobacillaceae bacterium MYW30-H2]
MSQAGSDYALTILHKLLDKYESSTAFVRGERTARRIQLAMTDAVVPKYKSGGMDADERRELHRGLQEWAKEGIVELEWGRFEVGNMLARVLLCWEGIDSAYRLLGRRPKADELETVRKELLQLIDRFGNLLPSWIQAWIADVKSYMDRNQSIPGSLIPVQQDKRSLLLKTLAGIVDKGDEVLPMRLFSKRYLKSSKAFETQVRSRIVSLLRHYWEYTAFPRDLHIAENTVELDAYLLSEIGIAVSHEDIAFCGPIVFGVWGESLRNESLQWGNGKSPIESSLNRKFDCLELSIDMNLKLDCADFPFGLALDTEVIDHLQIIALPISRIVTIENRTNYRHYIRHERKQDELVIYLGGFPSPGKRRFLRKLAEFTQVQVEESKQVQMEISIQNDRQNPVFLHWGDLDYGGILIFQTLRDSVWPHVHPWRMEPQWVDDLIEFVEPFDEEYRVRLEGLLANPHYEIWQRLIRKLLEVGGTLEQEAFLV